MTQLYHLFLYFIIYSVIGWMCEVVYCSVPQKRFVNRGVLRGPLCPIYGCGGLLVIFALQDFTQNPFSVFCVGVLLTSTLEYITSFLMEKLFHARWWDYSDKKFNLNGRVCLLNSLLFGLLSLVLMYGLHPFVVRVVAGLPEKGLAILFWCVLVIFLADVAAATSDGLKLRQKLSRINENLEKLKQELQKRNLAGDLSLAKMSAYLKNQGLDDKVKKLILQHKKSITETHFSERRLVRAFPEITIKKFPEALGDLKKHIAKHKSK